MLFHTGWFVESIVTQTLVVHVIRSARMPFFGARASWQLSFTTLGAVALGCWLPFSPWAHQLGLTGGWLGPVFWCGLALMTLGYVILAHLVSRRRLLRA
jgi:Mg2+-importing ATPase